MFKSLRSRLSILFVTLAMIPVIIVSGFLTQRTFNALQDDSLALQEEVTQTASSEISAFIETRENQLAMLSEVRRIEELEAAEQRSLLNNLLRYDDAYQELALLDSSGQEVIRVSRTEAISNNDLVDRSTQPEFINTELTQSTYFSDIRFDETIREPLITIATPVVDLRTGDVALILVAEFRFSPVWDLIARTDLGGANDDVYVTNPTGELVAHSNPSLVLSNTNFDLPEENGTATGLSGEDVILARENVQFGDLTLVVIAERPESDALEVATENLTAALIITVLALAIVAGVVTFTVLQVVRPIERLSQTAKLISTGDFTSRAEVKSQDEIGELAQSFNSMTEQLSDLIGSLEARVQARTQELQVAAQVSTQFSAILERDELLAQVVKQTREGFNLYHVSIFLLEDETLKLAAGSGQGDAQLTEMHFKTDDQGLVPRAARERQPVLVNDVSQAPDYHRNPALPATNAELSVPIIAGNKLIGVLDIQSEQKDIFSEDYLRVMNPLATQIGIAVQNAQLYTEAEEARQVAIEANHIKSQFLANMSHELRTPLNAILNFTAFVADGVYGPVNEDQEYALGETITSSKHLLSLINDVLDLTKIESGLMDLFIEEINPVEVIQVVEAIGKGLVKDKPIELILNVGEDIPKTYGDARRIRQVLINMLSNAIKFTLEGSITLDAAYTDELIKISVKDTGIGIAPEDKTLIFDSFRQAKHDLPDVVGTGLGMPISKFFVEMHGGTMWFESEVGQGSTFYIHLPVRTEKEANAARTMITEES